MSFLCDPWFNNLNQWGKPESVKREKAQKSKEKTAMPEKQKPKLDKNVEVSIL